MIRLYFRTRSGDRLSQQLQTPLSLTVRRRPRDFDVAGVISPAPIRFDRGEVVLTYFSPDWSAFVQDRYRMPRRKFGWYLAPYVGVNPFRPKGVAEFGIETAARYKNVSLYTRIFAMDDAQIGVTAGIRIILKGWP